MHRQERMTITQKKLISEGLDGLIVFLGVNVLALFGYWPGNHAVAGIIPANGKPILLVSQTEYAEAEKFVDKDIIDLRRYSYESINVLRSAMDAMLADALPNAINELGLKHAKIGLELSCGDGSTGKLVGDFAVVSYTAWGSLMSKLNLRSVVDAAGLIGELRSIKTALEVQKIKKTIHIAEQGLSKIYSDLGPGITEAHVSAMIESDVIRNADAHYSRAFTAVYSGSRSATQWVHYAYSSHRTINKNEAVIVELGCVADGYWCDLTRCTVAGKPNTKMDEVFKIVKEAQERGLDAVKIGEPLSKVNNACYDFFQSKGYGETNYRHQCGHGTGFNYHEGPPLHAASDTIMKEGMVMCIEPGLYFDNEFGLRVEDIFVVEASGARRLSKHPDSLT